MAKSHIEKLVPDEAVAAANGALSPERRLPQSSMRAALLAALPHLMTQVNIERYRDKASKEDTA